MTYRPTFVLPERPPDRGVPTLSPEAYARRVAARSRRLYREAEADARRSASVRLYASPGTGRYVRPSGAGPDA